MRVMTKRVLDPQYVIIYSFQDICNGISHQRVLGVFSKKDKAIEQIESQIEVIKAELFEFYDELNVHKSEGLYMLRASASKFSTRTYTFHIETFNKDRLYVCNIAE